MTPSLPARPGLLLGLGLLGAPLAAPAQTLFNNGATVFVNTGGTLQVNGVLRQSGAALLTNNGTLTVASALSSLGPTPTLDLGSGTLSVSGFVSHSGPLLGTTGTLRLFGSASPSVSLGGGTVPNLLVDKPAGTATLTSALQVRRVLTLAGAGNLDTNGQPLTLLSDATGTALIVNGAAGGVVQGAVTAQRYVDPSLNAGLGYRHLTAPVDGQTVAAFQSGGTSQIVNPAYNTATDPAGLPLASFPTVYFYDQARLTTSPALTFALPFDKGWTSPGSLSEAAPRGRGYTVQVPGGQTLAYTGAVGSGAQSLSAQGRGPQADAGWALLGNPYPAPLDWSTTTAASFTNLDNAVYVFQSTGQYVGQYRSFVNGVGASPLLGLGQAFFVRVSSGASGSGSLNLSNANRVTSYAQQAPVQRGTETRPLVRLDLQGAAGGSPADAWYAYAQAGAGAGFDGAYDAAKLPNPTGLNLSSLAAGQGLSIDGRGEFTAATVLPLTVGVPAAGSYSLTAAELLNLPAGLTAWLTDAATGASTPLAAGTRYAFTVGAAEAQSLISGRFTLRFGPAAPLSSTAAQLAAQVSLYPNPAREFVTVLVPGSAGAGQVRATLLNALGQEVGRPLVAPLAASGTRLTLPTAGLAQGVYLLRLQVGETTITKRLTVEP